jgi:hypothetical protein
MGYTYIDRRVILKGILRKCGVKMWTGSIHRPGIGINLWCLGGSKSVYL